MSRFIKIMAVDEEETLLAEENILLEDSIDVLECVGISRKDAFPSACIVRLNLNAELHGEYARETTER